MKQYKIVSISDEGDLYWVEKQKQYLFGLITSIDKFEVILEEPCKCQPIQFKSYSDAFNFLRKKFKIKHPNKQITSYNAIY